MKIVISAEQMKALDTKTINEFGIPSRVLMETAGKGCADYLKSHFSDSLSESVTVLCGFGNNGGDGYVIARWLVNFGYEVTIIAVARGNMSPETTANHKLCEKMNIDIIEYWETDDSEKEQIHEIIETSGVIIDAIYGIGFKGRISDNVQTIINQVNDSDAVRVAIDIPSGLNADNGDGDICFDADIILTIDAIKTGLLFGKHKINIEKVIVIPIGIPEDLYDELDTCFLMEDDMAFLPMRISNVNKGDCGRIAVFAGSPGFTGAAFMASEACIKAGAGLVTIFAHPEHLLHYAAKPWEIMVTEIPVTQEGNPDTDALSAKLAKYDLILFGPGFGITDFNTRLLTYILQSWDKKLVIDADGLSIMAKHKELLSLLKDFKTVLTPHWGEFCRLTDISMADLETDPLREAMDFTDQYTACLLLKSYTTIYIDNTITVFNTSGNDGLATGGSGDVLAGLVAGFLAPQHCLPWAPAIAAYHLGKTAELLATKRNVFSITPTEILDNIFKLEI